MLRKYTDDSSKDLCLNSRSRLWNCFHFLLSFVRLGFRVSCFCILSLEIQRSLESLRPIVVLTRPPFEESLGSETGFGSWDVYSTGPFGRSVEGEGCQNHGEGVLDVFRWEYCLIRQSSPLFVVKRGKDFVHGPLWSTEEPYVEGRKRVSWHSGLSVRLTGDRVREGFT